MNGPTPLEYLDQIAPQAPKKRLFKPNLGTFLIAGIAVLVLIIILVNVANAISNTQKEPWQRLSARLSATAKVVDSSTLYIKNSQLRSLNSDLKLYTTNTQRDLEVPLTQLNISAVKLPKSIITSESSEEMLARLEIGRLNAKYDSTYAREMSYQLATLLALLQQLYNSNIGPETKTFLETSYNNLEPTYEAISNFSASNE